MKGDYSRFSFDSKKHYRAVLMQQGRLQLDSDWNEQVQMAEYRYSAFFRSLVGRSGTPREAEMGLYLDASDKENPFRLTKGIFYIDGLLIENEIDGFPIENESPAGSLDGSEGKSANLLYYLDAWTREVSATEDGNLIDPAVGIETTTRLKTEWTVRCQALTADEVGLFQKIQKGLWPEGLASDWWRNLSTGSLRLNSRATDVDIKDNRLYRIEVYRDSPKSAKFAFKWSRDNASVCAEVSGSGREFTLENNRADMQNAFRGAAWIELYIPGETGLMLNMSKKGTSFENGLLTLDDYEFEGKGKTFIRRWDGVFPEDGEGNSLARELGLNFEYEAKKFYRAGDYWLILVRGGKIVNWEPHEEKTPDGVEHHFAALGILEKGGTLIPLHQRFNPLTSPDLSSAGDISARDISGRNGAFSGTLSVGGDTTIGGTLKVTGNLTAPNIVTSVAGRTGAVTLTVVDIPDAAPLAHVGAGGTDEHPVATTSTAGFMSATDREKLDSIRTSGDDPPFMQVVFSFTTEERFDMWDSAAAMDVFKNYAAIVVGFNTQPSDGITGIDCCYIENNRYIHARSIGGSGRIEVSVLFIHIKIYS